MIAGTSKRWAFAAATIVAVALLAVAFSSAWLDQVALLQGDSLQGPYTHDIRTDYVIGVIWAIFLTIIVAVWGSRVRLRNPLLIAWIVRAIVALGPMLWFDYLYGLDPDGMFGYPALRGFDWTWFRFGDGSYNTRLVSWAHIQLLTSSYNAARLSFALLGLVGVYLLYKAGTVILGREDVRIFYAMSLWPTVVFWASLLGKEPLALLGVCGCAYGVVNWSTKGGSRYLLVVGIGIVFASYIRIWLAPILAVPLVFLGWSAAVTPKRRIILVLIGVASIGLSPTIFREVLGVDLANVQDFLEQADRLARSFDSGGSTLDAPALNTTGAVAAFAPSAGFTVLFRPLPGEIPNLFGTLAGVENVVLLILLLRALFRTRTKDLFSPLVLWGLSLVMLWALVYAIDSYQNLGTASRHRLEITPFLLGALLFLGRRRESSARSLRVCPVPVRRVIVGASHG